MTQNFYTEDIKYEPKIDFDDKSVKVVLKNASLELIKGQEAIRQWIIKFCMTEKDAYEIYQGTGFGTRFKQLFGRKRLGYGYEEAEIERDFREGLVLCPAISQVTEFELSKTGKVLNISLEVELQDSNSIDVSIEKAYVLTSN